MRTAATLAAVFAAGCVDIPTDFVSPDFPLGDETITAGLAADLDDNGFDDLIMLNQPEDPSTTGVIVLMNPQHDGFGGHELLPFPDHEMGAVLAIDVVDTATNPGALDLVVLLRAGSSARPKLVVFPGLGNGGFDEPKEIQFGSVTPVSPDTTFLIAGELVDDGTSLVLGIGTTLPSYVDVPRDPQDWDGNDIVDLMPDLGQAELVGGYLRRSVAQPTVDDIILSDGDQSIWLENDGFGAIANHGQDPYVDERQQQFLPGPFVPTDPCDAAVLAKDGLISFVAPFRCNGTVGTMFNFADPSIALPSPERVTRMAVANLDETNDLPDVVYIFVSGGDTRLVSLNDIEVIDTDELSTEPHEHTVPASPSRSQLDLTDIEHAHVIPGDFAGTGRQQLFVLDVFGDLACYERDGATFIECGSSK